MWITRHGETEWSLSRRHTGLTDLPLTEEGEKQARALAPRLAGVEFALVLCSPLLRARETARLAGFEPHLDDRLLELDYGEYEGITTAAIREQRPTWDLWIDGCPGGDDVETIGARMDSLLADRVDGALGPVLVFGHGHALRILAARRLGLPAREGRGLKLETAAIGVIGSEHGRPALERWGV